MNTNWPVIDAQEQYRRNNPPPWIVYGPRNGGRFPIDGENPIILISRVKVFGERHRGTFKYWMPAKDYCGQPLPEIDDVYETNRNIRYVC